jgi:hypothetical protein
MLIQAISIVAAIVMQACIAALNVLIPIIFMVLISSDFFDFVFN